MNLFLQSCGGVLIAVILILTLGSHGKEFGSLMGLFVCCGVMILALSYLKPVLDFISQLESVGGLDPQMIKAMLKVVGIGLVSELSAMICKDSGNEALGKSVQLLATAVILWLSVPLFTSLMELIQSILGDV